LHCAQRTKGPNIRWEKGTRLPHVDKGKRKGHSRKGIFFSCKRKEEFYWKRDKEKKVSTAEKESEVPFCEERTRPREATTSSHDLSRGGGQGKLGGHYGRKEEKV